VSGSKKRSRVDNSEMEVYPLSYSIPDEMKEKAFIYTHLGIGDMIRRF